MAAFFDTRQNLRVLSGDAQLASSFLRALARRCLRLRRLVALRFLRMCWGARSARHGSCAKPRLRRLSITPTSARCMKSERRNGKPS